MLTLPNLIQVLTLPGKPECIYYCFNASYYIDVDSTNPIILGESMPANKLQCMMMLQYTADIMMIPAGAKECSDYA